VEEDDGPKRRTSPVHAEQAGMCEESDVPTRIHAPRQQQRLGKGYKVTLGARMQRCQTRHNP